MKPSPFLLAAFLGAALAITTFAATSDELRAEAEKLVEQARQAKSQGRGEEAQALMDRVRGIKDQLREQLAASGVHPPADRYEADDLRQKIEALRNAGRQDEAAQLERKFAARNAPRDTGGPERLRHVKEAIEHLRAAGLADRAEDLARLAEKMRFELERRDDSGGSPPPDKTQNALRELREAALKTERERNDMRLSVSKLEGQLHQLEQRLEEMEKMKRLIEELRPPTKPGGQ